MNEVGLWESLGQVSASQTWQFFRDVLRGYVREINCGPLSLTIRGFTPGCFSIAAWQTISTSTSVIDLRKSK